LEKIWKEAVVAYFLRYYPSICLEGLRKTTKNLSQDTQSPDRFEPRTSWIQSKSVNHSNSTVKMVVSHNFIKGWKCLNLLRATILPSHEGLCCMLFSLEYSRFPQHMTLYSSLNSHRIHKSCVVIKWQVSNMTVFEMAVGWKINYCIVLCWLQYGNTIRVLFTFFLLISKCHSRTKQGQHRAQAITNSHEP
jgi:hypothetical protein